jgi:preprotein translocase subunit SecG
MQVLFTVLTVLFLFASLALVIIILVQRPQGGGLSAAFGGSGAGGSETAFGGRTGDALTVTTVTAFVLYLALAMGLNIVDQQLVRSATAQPAAEGAANGQPPAQPGAPAGSQPSAPSGPLGLTQNPDGTYTLPGGGTLTPISGPPEGVTPVQPQQAPANGAPAGTPPSNAPATPPANPPATPPAAPPATPPATPPANPPATP